MGSAVTKRDVVYAKILRGILTSVGPYCNDDPFLPLCRMIYALLCLSSDPVLI